MLALGLLALGSFWVSGFIGWLLNLSSRSIINLSIWMFVATFAAFCFYR